MKFRFTAEDFKLDFGEEARELGEEELTPKLAPDIANALLEAEEAKCERVYSIRKPKLRVKLWSTELCALDSHTALLWNVEKIEGEK